MTQFKIIQTSNISIKLMKTSRLLEVHFEDETNLESS